MVKTLCDAMNLQRIGIIHDKYFIEVAIYTFEESYDLYAFAKIREHLNHEIALHQITGFILCK